MEGEVLIEIREEAFDPWNEISHYQETGGLKPGSFGACATFVGTMRDFNLGDEVKGPTIPYAV
jgi:molybdopterin synthase catalytic subunit